MSGYKKNNTSIKTMKRSTKAMNKSINIRHNKKT